MSPFRQNPLKRKQKRFTGFTLVELVVVITILAILGTIGFLSVGGYSSRARDSDRLADVANISKSLDLSIITTGSYPAPDNGFSVTYSGAAVWNQGVIGSTVLQTFRSSIAGGGLNKKPVDPLRGTDYVYSEVAEGNAYQIKADYEGDVLAMANPLLDTAYAAPGDPTIAYVRGNYGTTAKVSSGTTLYVLALPSIITNTGTTVGGSLSTASLSGTLVFNGKSVKWGNSYNPNALAYSGAKTISNPSGLPTTATGVLAMMSAIQSAYSGSDIRGFSEVSGLVNTPPSALTELGNNVIKTQLGGATVSSAPVAGCNSGYVKNGSGVCIETWGIINTTPVSGWLANVGVVKITSTITTYRQFIDLCKSQNFKWLAYSGGNSACTFDEGMTTADSLATHTITCNMSGIFVSGNFTIQSGSTPAAGSRFWWPATDLGHQWASTLDSAIAGYWGNTTFSSSASAIVTNRPDHYDYPTSLPVGDWVACGVAR